MDNILRLQYLEAMGIDVWLPRASIPDGQTPEFEAAVDNIGSETITSATDNWDDLQAEITNCTKCALCTTRSQTVFGSGNKQADWMLVGEAPGQHEDKQGLPFVGNAGLLLTEMLRAIGLNREEVFITNVIKCSPPNNRDPHVNEIESCSDYLYRQQQLVKPKIIVALGRVAAQTLLKTNEPLAELRGKVHNFNNTPVVVVYHPAYLLRFLPEKRKAWLDLTHAIQTFKNNEG
ncbi:uracil-DNA glycosylase [Methylobacter sp. S3L5C]|uniref:uracil-DNA glycosylase n=1 Tax=Methylobacter sp. S3L5C TaxID=2839024 RepID=UPI001FACA112|nr:uracil-DNA glycosylase [Methylobacter sp. S3L5C]UOA08977.1 uracil-DNA glycosylase [Methylobacter sp. S3L5C]